MANSFPADVRQMVDSLIASGDYDSEATVMREALRLLKQRDKLMRDVLDGIAELDRGEGIAGLDVFDELRRKGTMGGERLCDSRSF